MAIDLFDYQYDCGTTNNRLKEYKNGCRCDICRKEKSIDDNKRYVKTQKYVSRVKKIFGCQDCKNPEVSDLLILHHEEAKDENYTKLSSCKSISAAKKEIRKGVLLCPNCHARRHQDPVTKIVDYRNKNLR